MSKVKVNIELRVCSKDGLPTWGFVADDQFFPIGSTNRDKELAGETAQFYKKDRWAGIPLNLCGPNLDIAN